MGEKVPISNPSRPMKSPPLNHDREEIEIVIRILELEGAGDRLHLDHTGICLSQAPTNRSDGISSSTSSQFIGQGHHDPGSTGCVGVTNGNSTSIDIGFLLNGFREG